MCKSWILAQCLGDLCFILFKIYSLNPDDFSVRQLAVAVIFAVTVWRITFPVINETEHFIQGDSLEINNCLRSGLTQRGNKNFLSFLFICIFGIFLSSLNTIWIL